MKASTQNRKELKAHGYQIPIKRYLDSPIISPGGYEAGLLLKDSGRVQVTYGVEADNLPAVLSLHELCQEKGLSYVVSDIRHRMDRLDGEIIYRRNLLKEIKKLAQKDRKIN